VWAALDLLPIGWQSHRRIAPKSCEDFGRRVAAKSQIRIKIKKKIQKTIAAWVNSRKKIKHEVGATKKKNIHDDFAHRNQRAHAPGAFKGGREESAH